MHIAKLLGRSINHPKERQLTENRRFGLKNEVSTIFVSFDMHNELRMSSRTTAVAVAVNAISGMSNLRNFNLSALKFSLKTDNRLKMHAALSENHINSHEHIF